MKREPYKLLDLFSGIGGMSAGLERAGNIETVAFCEQNAFCRQVLAKHWPNVEAHDDVATANFEHLGPVDLVAAGFPCQDVSLAGPGAGLSGERSGLFWHILRTVRMVGRPKLLLENVAELLDRGMGSVLGALAQIGYDTQWHCIPASAVGLAQERDRCWIIAHDMQDRAPRLLTSADIGADRQGRKGGQAYLQHIAAAPFERGDCHPEPLVRGMARRIPDRVDRVGAIGNSVAPQIPELIGRAILAAEGWTTEQGAA